MHLTKTLANDPGLVAYYQFNEQGGLVTDRVGVKHASLGSGALRAVSTGPFGHGTSSRITVASPGLYSFGNTGAQLNVTNSGTNPAGEVVFSRLDLYPDQFPDSLHWNSPSYWIADNYGTNQVLSGIATVTFSGFRDITSYDEQNPEQFKIFTRSANADGNSWAAITSTNDCFASADEVGFNSAMFTVLGQFNIVYEGAFPESVNQQELPANEFFVFPNPASANASVHVMSASRESFRFVLYNAEGQQIFEQNISGNAELQCNLPAGVYVYRCITSDHVTNGTMVIY
jgi:hypothetical protein